MEKTNRCKLVPSCFAVKSPNTCKYAIITEGGWCIYMSKIYTCKSEEAEKEATNIFIAQEEAKMKELEKPKIKFEVGKWYTTNLGFQVEFIRDIKRDGQYNVFRHTKENDYRPYYADENGVECDGDYIITESKPPKRKPLPDGVLPMTDEELEEFSKIIGIKVKKVVVKNINVFVNYIDEGYRIGNYKAILYLNTLFDLGV